MATRWALVLALLAIPMGSAAVAKGPPAPSVAEQAAISRAAEQGRLIYAFDQAAWHSTDEMRRKIAAASLPADGGWVVEPHGGLLRVTYYGVDGEAIYALFEADMRGPKVVRSHIFGPNDDRALTSETLALVKARQVAMQHGSGMARCADSPFNVVVLPQGAGQPIAVYLLTPMETSGEYPFGGHYRIDVGPDGTVTSERAFTVACLNIGARPAGAGDGAMAVVSHVLDPTPTEIHVFMSLWMGQPVGVVTSPKEVWSINGDHIELIQMK